MEKEERLEVEGINHFNTKVFKTVDAGNTIATYWLTNVKPYIVKVQFEQANGQITVWKMESN